MTRGTKKLLGILLVICLVLSMVPTVAFAAGYPSVLYMKPNSNWLIDNARFAAYFFNSSGATTWVSMTDADGDGNYEVAVPTGYTTSGSQVIFCRMNPTATANNWNNKWNQTSDLPIPTDGTNLYTVANGSWDYGNGTWSTFTPVVETEPVVTDPVETDPVETDPVETDPIVTEPAGSADDYYLFGYINGANYGCEEDAASKGEYKFVDGKVTATFTKDSYVAVKTGDNSGWYMTDGWQGTSVTSVTLYNTSDLDTTADKLYVPGGVEVTFTLVDNGDDTFTLSYTTGSDPIVTDPVVTDPIETDPIVTEPDETEPTNPGTVPEGDFYLFGYIDGANYNERGYKFVDGKLSAQFEEASYVYVLRENDGVELMTNGWMGEVSSAVLYPTASLPDINDANKLYVPGGVEVTFTLVDNGDGSYTLSYTYEGAGSADDYYLFGYINGEDYAVGTTSIYKFENGTLTTTFPSDSYVGVKTGDNNTKYYTKGWLGAVSSATLYSNLTLAQQDKMFVPGGVEVTFTLKVNTDGTANLSYVRNAHAGIVGDNEIQKGLTLHCWNWSYENIEKNMAAIAEMGYTAIQTSPAQMMKEATVGQNVASHWWVFYQPVDFKMNTSADNALGTKEQFTKMCETADEYGIKVIVDVVANHLGNETGNDLSPAIPDYLRTNADYWHDYTIDTTDYTDREDITQHCMAGLPDLNTGNPDIQGYVLAYLKECIDAGADGFRFDATKHIETPEDDSAYASNFWPTVIGGAEAYAESKGIDLYCYGELLDAPGGDKLPILAYTKYLAVTDNSWGNCLRGDIVAGSASYNIKGYNKVALPEQLVLWAESHDTYATDDKNQNSSGISVANINKTWALVAARADAMGLYFARPDADALLGDAALTTGWANDEVKEINLFHNAFVGKSEVASNEGKIAYVERGDAGVVLVNVSGTTATVNVTAKAMADGTYTDQITGNTFTVSGGKITGTIGSTGIAVVYNTGNTDPDDPIVTDPTDPIVTDPTDPIVTDPTDPVDVDYYLFGYINGANYGCEEDSDNLGEYKFVDGKVVARFTETSYVALKTGDNTGWYMTDDWQGAVTSVTLYNTKVLDENANKLMVPGGVTVTFTLVDNGDDTFTLSYEVQPSVKPTITLKYPTLSFESEVFYNVYFAASDVDDVKEMGLITWYNRPANTAAATYESAEAVIPGAVYNAGADMYMVRSEGVPAKKLGDNMYIRVYAKLGDGTYAYSPVTYYNAKMYAADILKNSQSAEMKALVVAMLNYGAAAQVHFDHNADSLMNADLTADQKALVKAYSSDMIGAVITADANKVGTFKSNGGFSNGYPSVSFEGAFSINYYLAPKQTVEGEMTLYCWDLDTYNSVDVLTEENATAKITMTAGTNQYVGSYAGIAAKQIDETVFVAAVYTSGGVRYSSPVISYSLGAYCAEQIANGSDTMKAFAAETAVYGFYAKAYFASLNG